VGGTTIKVASLEKGINQHNSTKADLFEGGESVSLAVPKKKTTKRMVTLMRMLNGHSSKQRDLENKDKRRQQLRDYEEGDINTKELPVTQEQMPLD